MASQLSVYKKTPENLADFLRRIERPYEDKPIAPMDDTTAQDIQVIWDSIQKLAQHWQGHQNAAIPDSPMDRKMFWAAFTEQKAH